MKNTFMGCGDDLPTFFRIVKPQKKLNREASTFISVAEFCPKLHKRYYLPAKAPPSVATLGCFLGILSHSCIHVRENIFLYIHVIWEVWAACSILLRVAGICHNSDNFQDRPNRSPHPIILHYTPLPIPPVHTIPYPTPTAKYKTLAP